MDPKNHDPNNHVPEVTPEDDWGDVELTEEEQLAARKKLPKKRNDDMRRPKMLQSRDEYQEPEAIRVIPELDEDDFPVVVERLEITEDPKSVRSKRRSREDSDSEDASRRVEPSGTAVHKPAETTVRRQDDDWGTHQSHPVRWMVIGGVCILVILVAAVAIRPLISKRTANSETAPGQSLNAVNEPAIIYDPANFDMGGNTAGEAQQMLNRYAQAKTVDEVLPMIRNSGELEPILRKQWTPLWPEGDWEVPESAEWTIRKVEDRDFACLSGPMPDLSAFQYYFLRQDGKLLIDWEASTGYGFLSFKELAKGGNHAGVIRAEVSVSDMYTFTVPDDQYVCLRMMGPDRETLLWGYLKRGSAAEQQMRRLFEPGPIIREKGYLYRVTIRIEPAPADSLPNQWIISDFLHIDWLNP